MCECGHIPDLNKHTARHILVNMYSPTNVSNYLQLHMFNAVFGNAVETVFFKNLNFFINFFFMFSDRFDVLILKIIFKNKKIILIYFQIKNILNHKQ